MLEGDVGGFGAGSDFSWQLVGTYGFDVHCIETPLHIVIGYRALSVDFSENGRFGKNALDFVEHGPVVGLEVATGRRPAMARGKFGTTFLRLALMVAVLIATSPAYAQQGEEPPCSWSPPISIFCISSSCFGALLTSV